MMNMNSTLPIEKKNTRNCVSKIDEGDSGWQLSSSHNGFYNGPDKNSVSALLFYSFSFSLQ
jgi:hypothetical protein